MKSNGKKKGKYASELEKLRELNAIKEVLKKSDIENAALTNTSKDSETVSDTTIDNMLNRLNLDKNSNKDLEIVEKLGSKQRGSGGTNEKNSMKVKSTSKTFKQKIKTSSKKSSKVNTNKRKKR